MCVFPWYIPILVLSKKNLIRNKVHTRIKITSHDSLKRVVSITILATPIPITES